MESVSESHIATLLRMAANNKKKCGAVSHPPVWGSGMTLIEWARPILHTRLIWSKGQNASTTISKSGGVPSRYPYRWIFQIPDRTTRKTLSLYFCCLKDSVCKYNEIFYKPQGPFPLSHNPFFSLSHFHTFTFSHYLIIPASNLPIISLSHYPFLI